jgi:hypothetical protein
VPANILNKILRHFLKRKRVYVSYVNSISGVVLVLSVDEAVGAAPPRLGADELASGGCCCRSGAGAALVERGRVATKGAGALGRIAAQSAPRGQHPCACAAPLAQRGCRRRCRLPPLGAATTAPTPPPPSTTTTTAASDELATQVADLVTGSARRRLLQTLGHHQQDQLALTLSTIAAVSG